MQKSVHALSALAVLICLGACGGGGRGGGSGSGGDNDSGGADNGGDDGNGLPTTPTFEIRGTLSGLTGTGLVLQNNGGDSLSITDNGAFTFSTPLETGDEFSVTVSSQPTSPTQTCTVANGAGTVASADITNVAVSCTTRTYTIGGTVSGLVASGSGLVLQNGAGNEKSISADGAFAFPDVVASGEAYDIRVLTQPTDPVQQCTVEDGRGTVTNAAVSVSVTCVTQYPRFATSLDFNDASYSTYVVDATTGQLRPRGHVRTGANPVDFGRDATERFAYVLSRGDATLSVFTRDAVTGELSEVPGSPYATGAVPSPGPDPDDGANTLTAHPQLGFVYVANGSGTEANNIAGFAVDSSTGELTAIAGSPFAAGTQPFKLTIDASGRFAYAVNRGSKDIYTYSIDQTTGALTEVPDSRVSTGASLGYLTLHANGRFAYVTNKDDDSISAFTVDASTGRLTAVDGSPFATETAPAVTAMIHPNGRFLYVRNVKQEDQIGSVTAYAIDQNNGVLTFIRNAPIGKNSSDQWLDPAGEFLFVANRGAPLTDAARAGSISIFRIDAGTGELTALAGVPAMVPAPYSVSVDPSGRFVYSASAVGNLHRSYSLNRTTGDLTPLTISATVVSRTQPISLTAFSMKAAPEPAVLSSKLAYVSNRVANSISAFSIAPATGALTSLGEVGSPNGPQPTMVHPNGRFVLAADTQPSTDGVISSYGIDPATGALSVATSTTPTGGHSPTALAFNPNGRFVYLAHVFGTGTNPYRVAAFAMDPATGALSALPVGSVNSINTGTPPVDIAIAPNARFVHYITDDAYGVGEIDPTTGGFSAMSAPVPTGVAGQSALEIGPNGRYAYIAVGTASGGIERFTISWNGALQGPTPPEAPVPTGPMPQSIDIDPTGRFLYTANNGNDTISAFMIDQDSGDLTPIGTFSCAAGPVSIRTDYSGKFLYVLNSNETVSAYAINPDGSLTPISLAAASTGSGPAGLSLSANIH